jgi:hypothetical protein
MQHLLSNISTAYRAWQDAPRADCAALYAAYCEAVEVFFKTPATCRDDLVAVLDFFTNEHDAVPGLHGELGTDYLDDPTGAQRLIYWVERSFEIIRQAEAKLAADVLA